MQKALHLGCSHKRLEIEGYEVINVDIRPEVNPDVVADVKNLPFEKGTIGLIYASHLLEHNGRHELHNLMIHWRSLLCPKGILKLVVPDLTVAAIELLSGMTHPGTYDILYGAQSNLYDYHYCGFTAPALKAFLEKYGFEVENIETTNREIHCKAIKSETVFTDDLLDNRM